MGARGCAGMTGDIYGANALSSVFFLFSLFFLFPRNILIQVAVASPGSLGTVPETAVVYAAENHFKVYGILCLYVNPYLTGKLGG